ncbi:MAG TPA: hypothetical protein VK425_05105, partial [Acidimicrobiales bacterium]|nr:hypothetical protein [Acidimicrobiales bacterium]
MDRLERLVNLVVALLDTTRPLTREQLRERVGGYSPDEDNFRRNFERDKERLRQLGVPIISEPLDPTSPEGPVGYRIPRDLYELPDPGLDQDELAALGMAASAVVFEGAGEGTVTTALWKLAAASRAGPGPDRGAVAVAAPSAPPVVDVPVGPELATLFSAVSERRSVRFVYNGLGRRVDPYGLSFR